jgi:hypothetical protein
MREVILAGVEGAYGVDPTLTATDAVLVENPSFSFQANIHDRAVTKPSIGKFQALYGGTLAQLSFDVEVKGSGTAGTAPEYGPLLRACGFGETIVASTSVTYAPVSTGIESATIYYYQDGKRHVLTGCRGTVTGAFETGQPGRLSFTFTGHHADGDVALIAPTYDATVPPVVLGATFTVDSFAAVIAALNFDMSLAVATPPSIAASDGFAEIRITGRDAVGSFDPEDDLLATYDWVNKWQTGASGALSLGSIGATAGNIVDIDMAQTYYKEIGQGDRDGIRTLDISCGFAESSGDDEISLAFT